MTRRLFRVFSAVCFIALGAAAARAEVKGETVEHQHGGETLKSYLVLPQGAPATGKAPGVVIVPEWWGLNDYAKRRAGEVAGLGYAALAADIYGEGRVTADAKQAGAWAGKFRGDRQLLRERALAAIETLRKNPAVDPDRIAIMGYCFGGTTAIEAALSGAPIVGAVSFHGGLEFPTIATDAKNVKARVLVLHGADDPMVPPAQVQAFEKAMKDAGVKHEVVQYPGAVHSFTNPDADKVGMGGIKYNESADKKSWDATKAFFAEIFAKK